MDAKQKARHQLELLRRGAEEVIPQQGLLEQLERSIQTGIPLRVKLGIDPTSSNVHIGHMVPYGKLRQFQDLGHRAVLIIGDYTASIGDPSGRSSERVPLSLDQVKENAESYTEQIFRIVDPDKAEVRWQSEWYSRISLAEILELAGSFSLAQLLAHDTFRQRYDKGHRVGIHELLYPILQAYDSCMVQADHSENRSRCESERHQACAGATNYRTLQYTGRSRQCKGKMGKPVFQASDSRRYSCLPAAQPTGSLQHTQGIRTDQHTQ